MKTDRKRLGIILHVVDMCRLFLRVVELLYCVQNLYGPRVKECKVHSRQLKESKTPKTLSWSVYL